MKGKTLTSVCKIAGRISNPGSLTSLYRSIEIGPNTIRCCSEFGNLSLIVESTGLENPVLINTLELTAIAISIPPEAEVTLEEKDNRLHYFTASPTGADQGTLSFVQTDYSVPVITHKNFPWTPPADFADALLLASSACQAAAVSLGLYGIVIEPVGDKLNFMSSNTISLALSTVEKGSYPAGKITLRPPVHGIIASLLTAYQGATMDVTDDGIFILGDGVMAQLPLGQNLDHDLKSYADKFTSSAEVAKISSSAVKKFITRARSLTDKKSTFNVSLKVESGKLVLMHEGISSTTEQWMLAEGLDQSINYESKSFPADLLITPLEYIQVLVLDYLKDAQLVLKGESPHFTYVIGGN